MIKRRFGETKVPVKIWTDDVDELTVEQATNLANSMPIHKWVSLMPDTHAGYGMPIGGVLPLIDAISPFCVGADIGCGMFAIKTDLVDLDIESHKKIRKIIREEIPVGFNSRDKAIELKDMSPPKSAILDMHFEKARFQIGTLGGGNHFIEIQEGDDGNIWIMVHSGSRNIGYQTAKYYHDLAVKEGTVPNGIKELAYFDLGKVEQYYLGGEYYNAMSWCLNFAKANRDLMGKIIMEAFDNVLGKVASLENINIHHNYAALETHYERPVVIHRKGATLADENTIGIIPGSMGAKSYIVQGKGNLESFNSCSHGAGRAMSRTKAKKTITVEDYKTSLTDMNLEVSDREIHIDEAPGAYKDIETVMANQSDLVNILVELVPYQLPAIKG